jgi:hypothetical protein
VVFVGPIPFTFTPVGKVDLTLHGEGTFAESPTASIEHSAFVSAGFSLHGSHIDADFDSGCNAPVPSGTPLCTTLTLKPSGGPSGQVKASVGPTVYLAVDYVPHEVITGPYLAADGYVQADFQTEQPVWKVTAGIQASLGARFKVFFFDIDAST